MQDGISIIICCYNSGWIIGRTLAALKLQQLRPEIQWEVILVDNCCIDDTVANARTEMEGSDVNFRIVEEKKAGLAFARRRGINEVQYSYVIYCDDDNLLSPTYVQTVYDILNNDKSLGAVGGKGVAEFVVEPEPYVLEHIRSYAIGSQSDNTNLQGLWGAGLGLRTSVVREVYDTQKCYLVGRNGKQVLSGDDTELVYGVVAREYNIKGLDDISYIHVLAPHRLTEKYCRKMHEGFSLAAPILSTIRNALSGETYWNSVIIPRYLFLKGIVFNLIRLLLFRPYALQNINDICKCNKYHFYWGVICISKVFLQTRRVMNNHQTRSM